MKDQIPIDEYQNEIINPFKREIQTVLENFHGKMFSLGYAGYAGSSQELNIHNPFADIADKVSQYALNELNQTHLGLHVEPEIDEYDADFLADTMSEQPRKSEMAEAMKDTLEKLEENDFSLGA